jgi:hypothetical protein
MTKPLTTYHTLSGTSLAILPPTSLPTTAQSLPLALRSCHGHGRRHRREAVRAPQLRAPRVRRLQHPPRRRHARGDADRVPCPRARDDDERHLAHGPRRRRGAAAESDGGGRRVGAEPERGVDAVRPDGDLGVLPGPAGGPRRGPGGDGAGAAHRADERDGGRGRGRAPPRRGRGGSGGGHGHSGARARGAAGWTRAAARGAGDELHRHGGRRRHGHPRAELPAARLVAVN